jgi:hypothetical protein
VSGKLLWLFESHTEDEKNEGKDDTDPERDSPDCAVMLVVARRCDDVWSPTLAYEDFGT